MISFVVFLATAVFAQLPVLSEYKDFYGWLETNEKKLVNCEPQKKNGVFVLCDGTKVLESEIKSLFKMDGKKLLSFIHQKNIRVEILCDDRVKDAEFHSTCQHDTKRKMFQEITSLHGKFLPAENTILIRSSASIGSLIHEYIHFLQSQNREKIDGRIYKKERNDIQKKLTAVMDQEIRTIERIEMTTKSQAEIHPHLQNFMAASDALRSFSKWQDLIDERNIFTLYIKFGNDLGVAEKDLILARKNIEFICMNEKYGKKAELPECK